MKKKLNYKYTYNVIFKNHNVVANGSAFNLLL